MGWQQKSQVRRIRSRGRVISPVRNQESGQTVLLMALALVGLLLSTGLAVDGAMLMIRKAQLDRAVDAAALAGVVRLSEQDNLDRAHAEGQQVMAANGITVTTPTNCTASVDWTVYDYCGINQNGHVPGSIRYHAEAKWFSKTYFLSLIGIDGVPIFSEATAEHFALVDIYASDASDRGLINLSNLSIAGPKREASQGDPYSQIGSPGWTQNFGVYTFRVRIPDEKTYPFESVRVEIFDPGLYNSSDGTSTTPMTVYRTDGSYSTTAKCLGNAIERRNGCLFNLARTTDPNEPKEPNQFWVARIDENRYTGSGAGDRGYHPEGDGETLFRLYYLKEYPDGSLHETDLAYYIGKPNDQIADLMWVSPGAPANERMPAFDGTSYRTVCNPITKACSAGNVIQDIFGEILALVPGPTPVRPTELPFTAAAEPATTVEDCETWRGGKFNESVKRSWTHPTSGQVYNFSPTAGEGKCAGDGNFIVNLKTEAEGIYADPSNGMRDLYLQVIRLDNYSENGFSLWAGPPRTADPNDMKYTVPANINARQTYIMALESLKYGTQIHSSKGVFVYGIGNLLMNTDVQGTQTNPSDLPLTYLGPEFAGRVLAVTVFDLDSNSQGPMTFHFDTIPDRDWSVCFSHSKPICDAHAATWESTGGQQFGGTQFPLYIPQDATWQTVKFTVPSNFLGGRLYARYVSGLDDTFLWKLTTESRPYLVK